MRPSCRKPSLRIGLLRRSIFIGGARLLPLHLIDNLVACALQNRQTRVFRKSRIVFRSKAHRKSASALGSNLLRVKAGSAETDHRHDCKHSWWSNSDNRSICGPSHSSASCRNSSSPFRNKDCENAERRRSGHLAIITIGHIKTFRRFDLKLFERALEEFRHRLAQSFPAGE